MKKKEEEEGEGGGGGRRVQRLTASSIDQSGTMQINPMQTTTRHILIAIIYLTL